MGGLFDFIEQAIKDVLINFILSNLTGMFSDVNDKTGTIAAEVGQTPMSWDANVFSMIERLSDTVIIPIAGIIITFVLCYELISMVTEKNNLHDLDTWMIFKWFFKAFVAVWLVTNTFDIVMAVFDMGQFVVTGAAGEIGAMTAIDVSTVISDMQTQMETMGIGELEKVLRDIYIQKFKRPGVRTYCTKNIYTQLQDILDVEGEYKDES